jgi:arylsulfatase A-like enzyme
VDTAIGFIADAKQLAPDKPFFLYFATGAQHAPHHAPKEWADKYKGKFDDGWDAYREKVFARQKELGVIQKIPCCRAMTPTCRIGPSYRPRSADSTPG